MLAHYMLGGSVTPGEMLSVARLINLKPASSCGRCCTTCRWRSFGGAPSPGRSLPDVGTRGRCARRLAKGMVYKQIASELGLSTSTVRTHLHNVYGKLGAMDRAQAVLIATERGWI